MFNLKNLPQNNLALKCEIVPKNFIFPIKLLKTGFVANDKWRQAPDFDPLPHICWGLHVYLSLPNCTCEVLLPNMSGNHKTQGLGLARADDFGTTNVSEFVLLAKINFRKHF